MVILNLIIKYPRVMIFMYKLMLENINNNIFYNKMESVFNIEPENIKIRDKIKDNHYNFLDKIDIPHTEVYYKIVNTIIDYKLKNLYNFIYLRLYKINKKFPSINIIKKINIPITPIYFNTLMKDFINGNIINAIIIMNAIQIYIT